MIVDSGQEPGGFPYVDQFVDGQIVRRYLSALPTPDNHVMRSAPYFTDAVGVKPFTRDQIKRLASGPVLHTEVPVLDQNGQGACVGYAGARGMMLVRAKYGLPFVLLSGSGLYTEINGGRDAGADAGTCVQALTGKGVAPVAQVPGRPIRPAGVSDAARAAALRYRLRVAYQIDPRSRTLAEECATAVLMGYVLMFDVCAGGGYDTDAHGVVRYLGRYTNHEQHAGEGVVILPDGSIGIVGVNSWSASSWGGGTLADGTVLPGGYGVYQEAHFAGSSVVWALKYPNYDPQDPANPVPPLG